MRQRPMLVVLKSFALADVCFINELLYWVALRRLPLAIGHPKEAGQEFRLSDWCEVDVSDFINQPVTPAECKFAGLPPNPRYRAFNEGTPWVDDDELKGLDKIINCTSGEGRDGYMRWRAEALAERKAISDWDGRFRDYLEYHKSKISIALRDGTICAYGIRIKGSSWEDIKNNIASDPHLLSSSEQSEIPNTEGVFSKIDWDKGILYGSEFSYSWVYFDVEEMLSVYPIPDLPLTAVKQLCDSFLVELDKDIIAGAPQAARGRPPLPWEPFHVEVACLIKKNALPEKKEAAIGHFENWFKKELGLSVSRSSIGQKLTPYYQKFFPS
jgi:hypothetical protein